MSNEVEIAPLRSMSDFLLESARFQVPSVKDFDRWSNRVSNNLLYYQTNYFFMSIIMFSIVGWFYPTKMICGILTVFGLYCYVTNTKRPATKFKEEEVHPVNKSVLVIFLGCLLYMLVCCFVHSPGIITNGVLYSGYFFVYILGSVLVFLFGIILTVALIFIHASLRLRNIRNKLTNTIEKIGWKKTPMGLFFQTLGQQSSLTS